MFQWIDTYKYLWSICVWFFFLFFRFSCALELIDLKLIYRKVFTELITIRSTTNVPLKTHDGKKNEGTIIGKSADRIPRVREKEKKKDFVVRWEG